MTSHYALNQRWGLKLFPPPEVPSTASSVISSQPEAAFSPCGSYPKVTGRDLESWRFSSRRHFSNHFMEWTPDGKKLILNVPREGETFGSGVYLTNVDGSGSRFLVDANPGYYMNRGFQADLSPKGSMLVYTTCEFAFNGSSLLPDQLESYDQRRASRHYDVAILGIEDGTKRVLTKSSGAAYTGENPTWSPDGSQIAFLARKRWDLAISLNACHRVSRWKQHSGDNSKC